MSSAAIVIISSSPPRAFAGSPTPAESPSPLKSPGTPIRDGAKRFKSSGQMRDRFSGGCSSARALLTMSGAENIPLRSPGPPRFRSQSSKQSRDDVRSPVPVAKFVKKKTNATAEQLSDHFKPSKSSMPFAAPSLKVALEGPCCYDEDAIQELSSPRHTETMERSRHTSPRPLKKAVPRRLDWTPVKSSEDVFDTPGSGKQFAGTLSNLMSSYAFASTTNVSNKVTTKISTSGEQLKRKRIDLVMTTEATPASSISKTLSIKETKRVSKGKAPSKKALTITGLATSAYRDEQEREGRLLPMVEYLAAIQTADGADPESVIDASLEKRSKAKIPSKKARGTTKGPAKSRLVSPTSAMKTTLEQPFLFGPASQLVRDEAPTLVRDTLEALKKSEEILSDPFSPQWTQPFSIESNSPRAAHGTGRLVKKRNLWGAAGRDADNALLQVETVDMTDSPAVRQALAGKDALLQLRSPKYERTVSVVDGPIRVSTAQTPHTKSAGSVIDIYDFDTPGLPKQPMISKKPPVRTMHTLRPLEAFQEKIEIQDQAVEAASQPKDGSPKPIPAMPSYEGWADHALKKQIAAFGFKPVKKREKMVELLQRCWESKHSIRHGSDQQEELESALTHGHFLTKVHDVSARPTPKIKKPRAKRKSESGDPATPKEPNTRKKAPAKSADVSHKETVPRKRASKKKLLSDENVLDIDDIEDHIEQATSIHPGLAETSSKAEQRQKKPKSTTSLQERPATPPPTVPQLDFTSSSPPFEDLQQPRAEATINANGGEVQNPVLTPEQTPMLDIMIQILAAINHRPETEGATYGPRNHQTSPTWREKILMYDPIVLEELTAWLNAEGFQAIGEDREVSPLQVRDWCEQNGVCCHGVWGGWRGCGQPGDGE